MSKKPHGVNAVRGAIQAAEPVPPPSPVPDEVRRKVVMLENGLHRRTNEGVLWVCAPFSIDAETLDEEGRFGLLMSWADRLGVRREEVFGRELFAGECGELRTRLAAGGLTMLADQQSRQAFAAYLNTVETRARARVVSRCGWHHIGLERVFVLPGQVIGTTRQRVILQSAVRNQAPFSSAGTLEEWRISVAALAAGNSRLVFSVSCAFAGALLELSGADGGGFNLKGQAQTGKTTTLRAAASVWGGAPGFGAGAFVRSWRTTSNGLESVAAAHADALLCLDEMSEAAAREIGEVAYLLANGQGKSRANRDGTARGQTRFRVLFLSTGEVGLADKSAEAKMAVKAGQEVRLVDVSADAGVGLGIFEQLHDEPDPASLGAALGRAARRCYGTAGPAFVRSVVDGLAADPEYPARLAERMDGVISDWLRPYPDATGQVRSVARRFALVAVAGELASEAGITGWTGGEAEDAAARLFRSWLAARGTTGAREDVQAVDQLRAFIVAHGISRFERWEKDKRPHGEGETVLEAQPTERLVQNRAGWRRWIEEDSGVAYWRYFLTREGLADALAGLDFRAAVKVLAEAGYLVRDPEGKNTVPRRPPGVQGNMRLYEVKATILGAGGDGLADGAGA